MIARPATCRRAGHAKESTWCIRITQLCGGLLSRTEDRRDPKLRTFWTEPAEERDLAIAYASFGGAALPLLEKLRSSDDAPVLVQTRAVLRCARQAGSCRGPLRAGAPARSFERRGGREPGDLSRAQRPDRAKRSPSGRTSSRAIPRWPSAGINLAVAQLGAGDRAAAARTVRRLLRFHPDLDAARQLLQKVR